jgi:hypothetical protein
MIDAVMGLAEPPTVYAVVGVANFGAALLFAFGDDPDDVTGRSLTTLFFMFLALGFVYLAAIRYGGPATGVPPAPWEAFG